MKWPLHCCTARKTKTSDLLEYLLPEKPSLKKQQEKENQLLLSDSRECNSNHPDDTQINFFLRFVTLL